MLKKIVSPERIVDAVIVGHCIAITIRIDGEAFKFLGNVAIGRLKIANEIMRERLLDHRKLFADLGRLQSIERHAIEPLVRRLLHRSGCRVR